MIAAAQKESALLADMASANGDEDTLHVWWLGQSGFMVQWAAERLLFDPYLPDSLTKKYASTDKPHVRLTELCVDPGRLTGISRVTASHVHTDHLDGETLVPLAKAAGVRLVVPCHYEMFEFNTESPDEFARACEGLEQPFRVMQCWERIDLRSAKQDHLATA